MLKNVEKALKFRRLLNVDISTPFRGVLNLEKRRNCVEVSTSIRHWFFNVLISKVENRRRIDLAISTVPAGHRTVFINRTFCYFQLNPHISNLTCSYDRICIYLFSLYWNPGKSCRLDKKCCIKKLLNFIKGILCCWAFCDTSRHILWYCFKLSV